MSESSTTQHICTYCSHVGQKTAFHPSLENRLNLSLTTIDRNVYLFVYIRHSAIRHSTCNTLFHRISTLDEMAKRKNWIEGQIMDSKWTIGMENRRKSENGHLWTFETKLTLYYYKHTHTHSHTVFLSPPVRATHFKVKRYTIILKLLLFYNVCRLQ